MSSTNDPSPRSVRYSNRQSNPASDPAPAPAPRPRILPSDSPYDGRDQPRYEHPQEVLDDILSKSKSDAIKLAKYMKDGVELTEDDLSGSSKEVLSSLQRYMPETTERIDDLTKVISRMSEQIADITNAIPAAFEAGFSLAMRSQATRGMMEEGLRQIVDEMPELLRSGGGRNKGRAKKAAITVPNDVALYTRFRFALRLGVIFGTPKSALSVKAGLGIADKDQWPGWKGYGHIKFINDGVSQPPLPEGLDDDDDDLEEPSQAAHGNVLITVAPETYLSEQDMAEWREANGGGPDEGMQVDTDVEDPFKTPSKSARKRIAKKASAKKSKGKGRELEVPKVTLREVQHEDGRKVLFMLPSWEQPMGVQSIAFKTAVGQDVLQKYPDTSPAVIIQAMETYWTQATLNFKATFNSDVKAKMQAKTGVNQARARKNTVAVARDLHLAKSPLSHLRDFDKISLALSMKSTLPELVDDDKEERYIKDMVIDEAGYQQLKQLGVTKGVVWEAVYSWWINDEASPISVDFIHDSRQLTRYRLIQFVRYAVVADVYGHCVTQGTKSNIWHGPRFRSIAPEVTDEDKKKLLPVVPAADEDHPMDGSIGDPVFISMVSTEARQIGGEDWEQTLYPDPATASDTPHAALTLDQALSLPQYSDVLPAIQTALAATFSIYEVDDAVRDRNAILRSMGALDGTAHRSGGNGATAPTTPATLASAFAQPNQNATASGSGTSGNATASGSGTSGQPGRSLPFGLGELDANDPTSLIPYSQVGRENSAATSGGLSSLLRTMDEDADL